MDVVARPGVFNHPAGAEGDPGGIKGGSGGNNNNGDANDNTTTQRALNAYDDKLNTSVDSVGNKSDKEKKHRKKKGRKKDKKPMSPLQQPANDEVQTCLVYIHLHCIRFLRTGYSTCHFFHLCSMRPTTCMHNNKLISCSLLLSRICSSLRRKTSNSRKK